MKIVNLAVLIMSLLSMASSQADTPVDPVERKLEALTEQSPKAHLPKLLEAHLPKLLEAHLPKLLDYNLKKLDALYRATLQAAEDAERRKALEDSQTAWLAFFEDDGSVAAWTAMGGSYAYPAQVEQKIYQLRLRMYQLTTPFLQGWSEVPRTTNPEAEQVSGGNGG